jgi:hypothetical protein
MLQVLDLKDALESDRFLQAHFDVIEPTINTNVNAGPSEQAKPEVESTIFPSRFSFGCLTCSFFSNNSSRKHCNNPSTYSNAVYVARI